MVQTRRRARQRGAALLRLPTDVLFKIASHTVAPDLVVAAGRNVEARTALRKGTDEAERSRFGGIGMTIREAERVLRTRYPHILDDSDLASREAAGLALTSANVNIVGGLQQFVEALLAYGAEPSVPEDSQFGHTLLHTAHEADDPIALARLLLAAGANIDALATPPNGAGLSPLAWAIDCGRGAEQSYALASLLIEQGCDVVQAEADYVYQSRGRSLVDVLERRVRTEGNLRLADQIYAAFTAAGAERYPAALEAAQRRPRFDSDDLESDSGSESD